MRNIILFAAIVLMAALTGCQSANYMIQEKFGIEKRDILVSRVASARDSQEEAKEQFASALEQFQSVVNFSGGNLEEKYKKLNSELEDSEDQAAEVKDRIAKVEHVANALFKEWEEELEMYSNQSYKASSAKQLAATKKHYAKLIKAMKKAESKIEPVLVVFRDQVLFLKHNLNAKAIASLQSELSNMETDIGRLIQDMESSIAEANAFIQTMETE